MILNLLSTYRQLRRQGWSREQAWKRAKGYLAHVAKAREREAAR